MVFVQKCLNLELYVHVTIVLGPFLVHHRYSCLYDNVQITHLSLLILDGD